MDITVFTELEFFFRILIAGICGGLIGYERNNRLKEAGIRTHLIVALAAALIMVVSKYGFSDVTTLKGVALDPSRIAAQIVTGVGFLGAGMIFVRNQTISGLTTAAGVWATAGIGMTIGAGLYFLGVAATLLIVAAQMTLHKNFTWLNFPVAEQISMEIEDTGQWAYFAGPLCKIAEELQRDATDEPAQRQSAHQIHRSVSTTPARREAP